MKQRAWSAEQETAVQVVAGTFLREILGELDRHPEDCFLRRGLLGFLELASLTEEAAREEVSLRVQLPF